MATRHAGAVGSLDPASLLLRRALPALVVVALLVGAVRWFAGARGYINQATGVGLMTAFSIAATAGICFWSARMLRERTRGRRQVERDSLYRTIARTAPGGMVLLFDRDLRYLLAEGEGLRRVGLPPEALEGRTIFEGLEPEAVALIEQPYRAALEGKTTSFEMPFRDGVYEVVVSPTYDEKGSISGGLVQTKQITEQRKLEEQLRQSQKLEAVGQLAGGVAHDFNNLLTVISGYTSLALPKLPVDHPVRHPLEQIELAAERATALTHQLLAFSRKQVLQPRLLDVDETANNLLPMLDRLIESRIKLTLHSPPRQLPPVLFDPGQLEQVIINLALNARDAMPDGGVLSIAVDEVELDETYAETHVDAQTGRHIVISVSDTGHGMDEVTRERIFDPFFTTKSVGEGTGLGLATVHGIVRQSGGNIWVYSEIGRGTTFKIYIPTAPAGAIAEPLRRKSTPVPTAPRRMATVLVVEDNPAVRSLTTEILEEAGHNVLQAESPTEAKTLVEHHTVDVVLTDIVMPGGNGTDLASTTDARGNAPSVIYMSGYTAETISRQYLAASDSPFLEKPFTPTALLDLLAKTLADKSRRAA